MAMRATVATTTLIANPALTVIGQTGSAFVRKKKKKVRFVGVMTNVKDTVRWENAMMALKVTVALKTPIASLALIVIGKMANFFVRRKRVKVSFVGWIANAQGIAMS